MRTHTLQKKGHRPHSIFGPRLLWPNGWMDQDATWYGGTRRPGDVVGSQLPPKRGTALSFWPMSIVVKGLMDEHATWYGSRPRPRPHCIRRGRSSPPRERGTAAPLISAHVYCGHGRPSQLLLSSCFLSAMLRAWRGSATGRALDFAISRSRVQILLETTLRNNLGQVVYTYVPLSPSSISWYR